MIQSSLFWLSVCFIHPSTKSSLINLSSIPSLIASSTIKFSCAINIAVCVWGCECVYSPCSSECVSSPPLASEPPNHLWLLQVVAEDEPVVPHWQTANPSCRIPFYLHWEKIQRKLSERGGWTDVGTHSCLTATISYPIILSSFPVWSNIN